MNKTEAQQILDNCTTRKRCRCPLTNELYDVIQFNISSIDSDEPHVKLLSLIRALRYLYPQIKSTIRVDMTSLRVVDIFDNTWYVDMDDQSIAFGLHVPTVAVDEHKAFDGRFEICDNQQTDKPFVDVNEEPQALKKFIVDVASDNGSSTTALMCSALNHGYKYNTTIDNISKLEDFKVGMQFWLDESSMSSFATEWHLCEVTYIRQDVIFYKHVDDESDKEHYMIADSVLLRCGRAEPVEVDWTQNNLDARFTRPVSSSGKVIVKMKSNDVTLLIQAHQCNWKPNTLNSHDSNQKTHH